MSPAASKATQVKHEARAQQEHDDERVTHADVGTNSIDTLQTRVGNHAVSQLLGGGAPLANDVRAEMEARFGESFSDVRIYDDAQAHESAKSVAAKAYTYGNDIVFGAGRFSPHSRQGKHLLAHELAHVIQQNRGGLGPPIDAGAAHEAAASAAAKAITAGAQDAPVAVGCSTGVGVAREKDDGKDDDSHTAKRRIGKAVGELDRLQGTVTEQGDDQITPTDTVRAFDAINSALKAAHASGDKALVGEAERLKDRYDTITKGTTAARSTSILDQDPAASKDPLLDRRAFNTNTAARGFDVGLPVGRIDESRTQIRELEDELAAGPSKKRAAEIRRKIGSLNRRIAISTPTLKKSDGLPQEYAVLQNRLKTEKDEAKRDAIRKHLRKLDRRIGAKVPLSDLTGGKFGVSGATYVTIQIVGPPPKREVLATLQAHNEGTKGGRHAEVVLLDQLEGQLKTLPDKSRLKNATMIITGDQEVCKACAPVVHSFSDRHEMAPPMTQTTHAPGLTSQGTLSGRESTAKTTTKKLSDPARVDKIETAMRDEGTLGDKEKVRLRHDLSVLPRPPGANQKKEADAPAAKEKKGATSQPAPKPTPKSTPEPVAKSIPKHAIEQVTPTEDAPKISPLKSNPPKSGGGVKLRSGQAKTSSFFKDQVRITVQEQAGAEKPFQVTTTISLAAGAGIQGQAQQGATGASGSLSAHGSLSISSSTWMTEQEKSKYLADIAGPRGDSNRPEMTIIELIAKGDYPAAEKAISQAQSMMSEKQKGNIGDTEEISVEGDVSGGVGASRGMGRGAGLGAHVELSSGEGVRVTRTIMPGGKELYAVAITHRSGRSIGGTASANVVSVGYSDARNESRTDAVSIELDPGAADYESRKKEILAVTTIEQLNAIAAKQPGGPYSRSKDKDQSKVGTTSAGILGFGIDLDQGRIDEEGETTDRSGTTRRLKGGASLGGSFTAMGRRLNPASRTDSFSAVITPDNKATGVTQSEKREVDVTKSATNLAESFAASPVGTAVAIITGSKEIVKERVDTTGVNLEDDSFARIAKTAADPSTWFAAWDKSGASRGAATEWEQTRQAVLAAKGDRYLISQALKEWEKGDSGRSGDVERLVGDTGVGFDFADEIADQKHLYDELMSPNLLANIRQLAAEGEQKGALGQLYTINDQLRRLLQAVQKHANKASDPGKFAEMQQRITERRSAVRQEIANLLAPAGIAKPKADAPSAGARPLVAPLTAKQATAEKGQALVGREEANDDIHTQVLVCQNNREIESNVFAEVEAELDDFYVDIAFVFNKLNSLKPMYDKWDAAIETLRKTYPLVGDPPDRANPFAPNREKWNGLNKQAMK